MTRKFDLIPRDDGVKSFTILSWVSLNTLSSTGVSLVVGVGVLGSWSWSFGISAGGACVVVVVVVVSLSTHPTYDERARLIGLHTSLAKWA